MFCSSRLAHLLRRAHSYLSPLSFSLPFIWSGPPNFSIILSPTQVPHNHCAWNFSAVSVFALFICCHKFCDVSTQFVNNFCCKFIGHLIVGDVDKLASLKSTTPAQVVEAHLVSNFFIQWVLRMDELFDHVGKYFSRAFQHLIEAKVLDPFLVRFHHSFDEVVGVTGWGDFLILVSPASYRSFPGGYGMFPCRGGGIWMVIIFGVPVVPIMPLTMLAPSVIAP